MHHVFPSFFAWGFWHVASAEFLDWELLSISHKLNVFEFPYATKDVKVLLVFMSNKKFCATNIPLLVIHHLLFLIVSCCKMHNTQLTQQFVRRTKLGF